MSSPRPEPESFAPSRFPDGRSSGGPKPDRSTPVHDAADLLGGGDIALIVLGEQTYRLRLTRAGKLILNK